MSDTIEVIDIIDQPDGSAIMTMDVEPGQVNAFVKTGLNYMIKQMRLQDDVQCVEPNTFENSTRTIELTDDELNTLFQFGVISALKRGIQSEQNQEEEENRR